MQSEKIDLIIPALLKAQSEMGSAVKKADNPFFKSKYATLEMVQQVCEKPLFENNLLVMQGGGLGPQGNFIYTQITHVSGQWVRSEIALPTITKAQDMGSCITYYRRYGLAALLNIVQEDDDGNQATRGEGSAKQAFEAERQANGGKPGAPSMQKAGVARGNSIREYVDANLLNAEVVIATLAKYKVKALADLPKDVADKMITAGMNAEIKLNQGE